MKCKNFDNPELILLEYCKRIFNTDWFIYLLFKFAFYKIQGILLYYNLADKWNMIICWYSWVSIYFHIIPDLFWCFDVGPGHHRLRLLCLLLVVNCTIYRSKDIYLYSESRGALSRAQFSQNSHPFICDRAKGLWTPPAIYWKLVKTSRRMMERKISPPRT